MPNPILRRKILYPGRRVGAAPAPWVPTDIPGLQLWLDFADPTVLFTDSAGMTPVTADGDVIGRALDKSGSLNHVTQGTTANKPIYRTGIQNGLSIGRADGTDYLQKSSFVLAQPFTTVAVFRTNSGDDKQGVVQDTSGNFAWYTELITLVQRITMYAGGILRTNHTHDVMCMREAIWNGASSEQYLNGLSVATGNAGANGFTNDLQVMTGGGGYELKGDMCEFLIYNSVLSVSYLGLLNTYLNTKWVVY